ncbi:MAG: glycosyltransferase [Deltaproteobacteria bacterium]|nr:glycosyltransferase [Deltaproteobacteria bacterium]
MSLPDVDVIIGSRDGKDLLLRCLESVYLQRYEGHVQVTVVDNHSRDQSNFLINSRYPQVQHIVNSADTGQAAAYNVALSKTSAPFALILAQDAELESDFLSAQVALLQGTPGFGGAAARVLLGHDSPGGRMIDSTGIALRGAHIIPQNHAATEDDRVAKGREVFGPAGAAAFWDRRCLDAVRAASGHWFDEDLIAGHLDADLAWRARWLGYRFWYNPAAIALHQRGILYAKDRERAKRIDSLRARNRVLVYRKNLLFDGWARFGGQVRSSVRREMFDVSRKRGVANGVDAWLGAASLTRRMKKHAAGFESHATATPERMFQLIFSHRAQSGEG